MSSACVQEMLQDVSGRATWSKKCFKMSLADFEQKMLQDVSGRELEQEIPQVVSGRGKKRFKMSLAETWRKNASRCLWQEEMYEPSLGGSDDEELVPDPELGARNAACLGRGTWRKKCFKMYLAESWSKKCCKMSLAEALGQEMFQDVPGRGTLSKSCFWIIVASLTASRYLWQRHLEQDMLQMSLSEALRARNAARCPWQRHLEQEMLEDVSGRF